MSVTEVLVNGVAFEEIDESYNCNNLFYFNWDRKILDYKLYKVCSLFNVQHDVRA